MWGSHLNTWKIHRKRPEVDIPSRNNVNAGSGESSPLSERDLCRKDSPSSRMCYSTDCKTLSKSELLSPRWFVHRKHKPRKSESNTAWFRFPETTYTFNSNFSLLQCSLQFCSYTHLWSFLFSTYAVSTLRARGESDQQGTRSEFSVKNPPS